MDQHRSPSFPPNSSPKLQWGSPALRPVASFPPMNRMAASPTMNTPPHGPGALGGMTFEGGMGTGSPQFANHPYQHSFRTPEPHHSSPDAQQPPWSENSGKRKKRRPKAKVSLSLLLLLLILLTILLITSVSVTVSVTLLLLYTFTV